MKSGGVITGILANNMDYNNFIAENIDSSDDNTSITPAHLDRTTILNHGLISP
jgi:hypothetical protein